MAGRFKIGGGGSCTLNGHIVGDKKKKQECKIYNWHDDKAKNVTITLFA